MVRPRIILFLFSAVLGVKNIFRKCGVILQKKSSQHILYKKKTDSFFSLILIIRSFLFSLTIIIRLSFVVLTIQSLLL